MLCKKNFLIAIFLSTFVFLSAKELSVSKKIDEDLQFLSECFSQGYVLFDDAEKNGFDIKKISKDIKKAYKKNASFSSDFDIKLFGDELTYFLFSGLKDSNCIDAHINIKYSDYNFFNYYEYTSIFWSNTYLKKNGNDFYVLQSDIPYIKKEMKYTGNIKNIYKDYSSNDERYRFAVVCDFWNIPKFYINLDGKDYEIKLSENKIIKKKENHLSYIEDENFVYIGIGDTILNTDDDNKKDEAWKKIYTIEEKLVSCNKKKNFIIDLRSNNGGYNDIMRHFIAPIFYGQKYSECYKYQKLEELLRDGELSLHSHFLGNSDNENKKYFSGNRFPVLCKLNLCNDILEGKVYILTNQWTSSSCEYSMAIAYCINKDKVIQVGSNTKGVLLTSNPKSFTLPNSKIEIKIPMKTYKYSNLYNNLNDFYGETKGFYPQYWVSNDKLLESLSLLLNDNRLKIVLPTLNNEMQ